MGTPSSPRDMEDIEVDKAELEKLLALDFSLSSSIRRSTASKSIVLLFSLAMRRVRSIGKPGKEIPMFGSLW